VKVLFDQGTPAPLRRFLPGHEVRTAYEMGWSALLNSELLRAAEEAAFDAIVTTDKNMRHQQDVADLRLDILVLPTTDWSKIRRNAARAAEALGRLRPGTVVDVPFEA
jgi:hypothetical protein